MSTTPNDGAGRTDALRAMLAQRLQAPQPETYDERLEALSSYMKAVTQYLAASPEDAPLPPLDAARMATLARQLSDEYRSAMQSRKAEFVISPCDVAGYSGVLLITLGAVAYGPAGAVAGFAIAVYVLESSCT